MCTFKDERTVMVCDVAIGRVKHELKEVFGDRIRCTPIDGQGTLVEAASVVDGERFTAITQAAIAPSQDTNGGGRSDLERFCLSTASATTKDQTNIYSPQSIPGHGLFPF